MTGAFSKMLARLQVKHTGDGQGGLMANKWGNKDVYPIPPKQREFTFTSYISFWAIASMTITGWSYGGSLVSLGLTMGEGIACAVISSVFVGLFAYLCGHPGSFMHLGFPALTRTSFGLYGSYLPILLLVFENVIFFGIHGYFGGLAVVVVLSALSPGFKGMKNTLPLSGEITSQELLGYMIYVIIFLGLLVVPPAKYRKLVWPAACVVTIVFFGLFGWAISINHGTPGSLVKPKKPLSFTNRSFIMLYAISSAAGSTTAYASRISNWTRYSKGKNTPTIPMLLGPPIFGSLAPILGILATSAVHNRYGQLLWNPLSLLIWIQKEFYTPGARAATFFAGCALFWALIINNMMGKILPAGMDVAGMFPRYLTTRRGAFVLTIIGVLCQPWRFVNASSTFLTVLSSFGVFVAPATGILVADYWIVRRCKWKIPDIFDENGIYWYTYGVNWRAVAAFILSIVFSMPGFIASVKGTPIAIGWKRMYQLSYIVNISIAALTYCIFCFISPPKGLGIAEPWETESLDDSRSNDVENSPVLMETEKHQDIHVKPI